MTGLCGLILARRRNSRLCLDRFPRPPRHPRISPRALLSPPRTLSTSRSSVAEAIDPSDFQLSFRCQTAAVRIGGRRLERRDRSTDVFARAWARWSPALVRRPPSTPPRQWLRPAKAVPGRLVYILGRDLIVASTRPRFRPSTTHERRIEHRDRIFQLGDRVVIGEIARAAQTNRSPRPASRQFSGAIKRNHQLRCCIGIFARRPIPALVLGSCRRENGGRRHSGHCRFINSPSPRQRNHGFAAFGAALYPWRRRWA